MTLPAIPVIRPGPEGLAGLVDAERQRLTNILLGARTAYSVPRIVLHDRLARSWARRAGLPYADEIDAIAGRIGLPSAWMLNLSYEWACTVAGLDGPGGAPRHLRTFDWDVPGLGANVIAVAMGGAAGPWLNLSWPGFAGVVQGFAPGRFVAAINHAPMTVTGLGRRADRVVSQWRVWNGRRLPPVLLLRQVFEQAPDYAAARARLIETPVALPVIFTIAGCRPGETAVIQRLPERAVVHDGPGTVTNHWLDDHLPGRSRSISSRPRLAAIRARLPAAAEDFAWLTPPVLNPDTRLAIDAVPAEGRLRVQGFEHAHPATAVLEVDGVVGV